MNKIFILSVLYCGIFIFGAQLGPGLLGSIENVLLYIAIFVVVGRLLLLFVMKR